MYIIECRYVIHNLAKRQGAFNNLTVPLNLNSHLNFKLTKFEDQNMKGYELMKIRYYESNVINL